MFDNLIGKQVTATIPNGFEYDGSIIWKTVSGIVSYVKKNRIVLRDGIGFYADYLSK